VAALLPDDASKWLVALGKNIDVLELWKPILLSIVFVTVYPQKLKGGKAFRIVLGALLIYLVLRVGWRFAFS
jgi:hypothetical protein